MRRTYATRLLEKDVPIKTVQVLMGHKDISTTMNIYTHIMPEKKTTEVQCLNDIFRQSNSSPLYYTPTTHFKILHTKTKKR